MAFHHPHVLAAVCLPFPQGGIAGLLHDWTMESADRSEPRPSPASALALRFFFAAYRLEDLSPSRWHTQITYSTVCHQDPAVSFDLPVHMFQPKTLRTQRGKNYDRGKAREVSDHYFYPANDIQFIKQELAALWENYSNKKSKYELQTCRNDG